MYVKFTSISTNRDVINRDISYATYESSYSAVEVIIWITVELHHVYDNAYLRMLTSST